MTLVVESKVKTNIPSTEQDVRNVTSYTAMHITFNISNIFRIWHMQMQCFLYLQMPGNSECSVYAVVYVCRFAYIAKCLCLFDDAGQNFDKTFEEKSI